jgi:hypothetical protein
MARSRIPARARIFALIVVCVALGVLALQYEPYGSPNVDQRPDWEGKLTFDGPGYRLRVPREQVVYGSSRDGFRLVWLSIDRRELGSPDEPGPPRIVCAKGWFGFFGFCRDLCETEDYCEHNGWYNVLILPASQEWGRIGGPSQRSDSTLNCGNDGLPGLEYCWDSWRLKPSWPVSNVYAVRNWNILESTWVNMDRDADGAPTFYVSCPARSVCTRDIEKGGARVQLRFPFSELENWQRLEPAFRKFVDRLIEPSHDLSGIYPASRL